MSYATTISLNEAAPCNVEYVTNADRTYVKVAKEDFEKILLERRSAKGLLKVWMALALTAAVMLAGTAWWFTAHPATKVVLAAPILSK